MNYIEDLEQQQFYLNLNNQILYKTEKYGFNEVNCFLYIKKLDELTIKEDEIQNIKHHQEVLNLKIELNEKIIEFIKKNYPDEKTYLSSKEKEKADNEKLLQMMTNSLNSYLEYSKKIDDTINDETEKNKYYDTTDKNIITDEYMSSNKDGNLIINNTFGADYTDASFDSLISESENSDLQSWYKFLKDLHEKPIKSFVINKNTICNFKLIFKNPYTGLTTDKENVVHLSHSTSSKKSPVFSVGHVSYKAVSTGVRLLAGSLVTAALENVPLPYLHAISYMNHSSVEDLPPLDLYIIPIEKINDDGRYEVLMIKGIQFVDMKQNDNASSTGVYYAFNFFAEDIVPLDFSETRQYFKIQYEGNNNLNSEVFYE